MHRAHPENHGVLLRPWGPGANPRGRRAPRNAGSCILMGTDAEGVAQTHLCFGTREVEGPRTIRKRLVLSHQAVEYARGD